MIKNVETKDDAKEATTKEPTESIQEGTEITIPKALEAITEQNFDIISQIEKIVEKLDQLDEKLQKLKSMLEW